MIEDVSIKVEPKVASSHHLLKDAVARELRMRVSDINDMRITRRSVDARKSRVILNLGVRIATGEDLVVSADHVAYKYSPVASDAPCMVIVGAGPAGLFAALEAIKLGWKSVVVERGCDVDSRRLDIAGISRDRKINPVSNYCFGEGGAGAYSDGKLYTRSKKRGSVEEVLRTFVDHGASEDILIDAHPHIGSDKLPGVIRAMRQTIIDNGGEVLFETMADGLIIKDSRVTGVEILHDGKRSQIIGDAVILATGHSAHDTFRMLHDSGVGLEAKGIAVGVRLEHPQPLIDRIQYHNPKGRGEYLPAAEYSFVTQVEGRGVYSFCMCPGGVVVPAGSSEGELVVNGMSASGRLGRWANSGMVVELHPGDIATNETGTPLEMLELQEMLERQMYAAAGNSIVAPAQRMKDFVDGRISTDLPRTSYAPGVQPKDFNTILPPFIASRLRQGFMDFGRKAHGFLTNDAVMIGLESRTSSPIRILRDSENLTSVTYSGLYPAGEGAGYAGGIVSAAIDGIRCARAAAQTLTEKTN